MTVSIEMILPELPLIEAVFETMVWAEDEIEKAQARHGEPRPRTGERGTGPIWNSFSLLKVGGNEKLLSEPLYRAHCREILNRVANGADTRPGTDAEMIIVIHEASLVAPITSGAACLYFRLVARSVPELARARAPEIDLAAYEKVHGRVADDYEAELRRKLRQNNRKK